MFNYFLLVALGLGPFFLTLIELVIPPSFDQMPMLVQIVIRWCEPIKDDDIDPD